MKVRSIAALTFGVSIVLVATPAAAKTLDSYSSGGHAFSYSTNRSAAITDTLADGDEVYANYQRTGENLLRVTNHNGNGSTAYSANRTPAVFRIQACTELDFVPDSCGAYDSN